MWIFSLPTKVQFGAGTAQIIGDVVANYGRRPVVVTDTNLAGMGHIQPVIARLNAATVFSDVSPNPTTDHVDALAAVIREVRGDVIVAIGGGSPLDCAKAASALVTTPWKDVRRFHTGGQRLSLEHLPVVAVPTTAGTGSEVTPFVVLDDPDLNVKAPLASPSLYPTHALIDPELTLSLPVYTTAATGLDALSHALEGFWSKNNQPTCDLFAMEAARLIFANLETAVERPNNLAARSHMAYAALLAGMAFQLPKNAMVHACSFPLSKRFHLAHGAACAFTLEFAINFNAPTLGDRFIRFIHNCGFSSMETMAARITELKRLGGLPVTLADAEIPLDAIPALVNESFHPLINNNPRAVTRADLEQMYRNLA